MQQYSCWRCKIVQCPLGITTWNNSNRSFSRTWRWTLPPKGNCPCSLIHTPDHVLHQGLVLFQLFPVSHPASQAHSHSATPTLLLHNSLLPAQRCCACVPQQFSCSCKFSTSLFQNQRQHLLPGISKWQEGKLFWGYSRVKNDVFVLLILVAVWRTEKIRKRKLGKDEGTVCWEMEEKGTLLVRKKTSGFFLVLC